MTIHEILDIFYYLDSLGLVSVSVSIETDFFLSSPPCQMKNKISTDTEIKNFWSLLTIKEVLS